MDCKGSVQQEISQISGWWKTTIKAVSKIMTRQDELNQSMRNNNLLILITQELRDNQCDY